MSGGEFSRVKSAPSPDRAFLAGVEDAIWVTKKQLLKLSKDKEIILPKKYDIAFCLIENWFRNN